MIQVDVVPALVILVSALGGGAGIGKLVEGLLKIRQGMSARETERKIDIVKQRDTALAREAHAWTLVDAEAAKRRTEQEYSARLRVQLIEHGIEPEPAPVLAKTITKAQLNELRATNEE